MTYIRNDGRAPDEMRLVKITKGFISYPEGSVLIEMGNTRVLCNVSVDEDVPPWLKDEDMGWITAEYAMLPRSTHSRQKRERGNVNNRSVELSRLIGRALRPAVDLKALGPLTLRVDCDVIQADGGTRCTSITGAYIALKLAEKYLLDNDLIDRPVIRNAVAAISVGVLDKTVLLDLNYIEDKNVDVDLNVIMNDML
ncbi:MAG: ribonuclease PH, partial [Promethearchaeota archaeon]